MPMRENCRHFESRKYDDDGEVTRFCRLDLAPEAPWRCPENCASYAPTLVDGTFETGSLDRVEVEDEPDESPEAIADLLDDAERIVDEAEPEVLRGLDHDQPRGAKRWWPFGRRRHSGDDGDDTFRLSNR
ncbi:MAG TPA: hypothetical protein VGI86_20220 [Acidimicrobiia bacterium]